MNAMKLMNISISKYFHMIPLWKSPIKLPVEPSVELPVIPQQILSSRRISIQTLAFGKHILDSVKAKPNTCNICIQFAYNSRKPSEVNNKHESPLEASYTTRMKVLTKNRSLKNCEFANQQSVIPT